MFVTTHLALSLQFLDDENGPGPKSNTMVIIARSGDEKPLCPKAFARVDYKSSKQTPLKSTTGSKV